MLKVENALCLLEKGCPTSLGRLWWFPIYSCYKALSKTAILQLLTHHLQSPIAWILGLAEELTPFFLNHSDKTAIREASTITLTFPLENKCAVQSSLTRCTLESPENRKRPLWSCLHQTASIRGSQHCLN